LIEVNLLPGGKRRSAKKGGGRFPISIPSISSIPADPYVIGAIVTGVATIGLLGWAYLGLSSGQEDVQVALAEAVNDSSNYADLIQRNEHLAARRDSIAQKVDIIQEIDEGRYVWPHVLDEVARALPDYTWLTQVLQVTVGDVIEFQVHGKAGNNFALTTFWEALESSPFIRNVHLVQTEQVVEPTGELVFVFQLDASYEAPPMELLETVPLFGSDPFDGNR
jgi:Tfp pilus assembly protein PilN